MIATYNDWENLVKKQLKTENIFDVLSKPNLEGITVKPFYTHSELQFGNLPKIEESTHLVADFYEQADENVFAFLVKDSVPNVIEKKLFLNADLLATNLPTGNDYYCLSDLFNESEATFNDALAKDLLAKNTQRRFTVDVSLHQNAGASIVQQIAFALAKTKEVIEICGEDILDNIMFRFAVGGNYFFEIAKLRAFKLAFNQLSKEYGKDLIPYIYAETSLRNKTIVEAENNLIRSTLELAAAMVGGADAIYTHDFKLENNDLVSREVSFKQQIVLAYESIINVFEDATNGSYYIDDITSQFVTMAWDLFIHLEEKGGYLAALQSKEIANMIYEHAVAEQNWVKEGKIKLIGINIYPTLEPKKSVEEMYVSTEIKAVRWSEMFE